MRAVNSGGPSAGAPNAAPWYVVASPSAPPPKPPAAPAGLSATAGVQSVTLSWNNPSDSSITGYEYNVNHNDTSTGNLSGWSRWTAIPGSGASTTSHTLTGLTPGREYRYHVRAVNSAGPGTGAPNAAPWYVVASPSAPKPKPTPTPTPAPKPNPPAAPTGLTATPGNGSVTLDWDDPSDASITRYEYNVNHNDTSTGNLSGWGPWTVIPGAGASTTSHTFTGLTNGKEYRYHLRAVNSGGAGTAAPNAAPWFVKAVPGNPAPFAPTGLSVTPGDGYLDISWNAVSGATGYDVRAKEAGASDWQTVANKITATSLRYVTARTIDYVAVRARNGNATGPWAELSRLPDHDWLNTVQTSGASIASAQSQSQLAAPASVTVTRDNYEKDEKLHVTWTAVTGAGGYNLTCSDADGWGTWWSCGSVNSGATTTLTIDTDSRGNNRDLVWTRPYLVAVRAVNNTPSDASDWASASNARPALQPTKQLNSSHDSAIWFTRQAGSISLSWISPLYGKGYEIDCATRVNGVTGAYTRCADVEDANVDTGGTITATITSWTANETNYEINDSSIYDIKVRTTNEWGSSPFTLAPLINPIILLTVSDVGLTTATLNIANRTGNWYYKHTGAGATCGGPVSGTSKALTGLITNTRYTYSAYSDSGCSTLLATAAQFTTTSSVSNLGSSKTGPGDVSAAKRQAVAFTTGAHRSGYVLKGVTVPLRSASASGGTNGLQLKLHAMAGTGQYSATSAPSTTALATLSGTAPTASTWTDTTFTCSGSGCSLSANTVYFVVATFDGTGKYEWAYALTETQTAQPSDNAWDIEFGHYKEDAPNPRAWASWSDYNLAEIAFENIPNPELTASNVAATTATLTIAHHTGNWYYKHTGAGATCDGPVSGTSKALTGLTANTTYTYSAYSDSACTTGNLLAAAAGFTTFSSVSNLGSTKSGDSPISSQYRGAVAFTTGSNSGGYVLKTVTMPLRKKGGNHGVTATLHAMKGTGEYSSVSEASDTALATLTGTAPAVSTWSDTTFTCAGSGCRLSSDTTYFLVLTTFSYPGYAWAYAASETETAQPSGNGWSVEFGHYKDSTYPWGSHSDWNVAEIAFVNAPGLTSSNVAATAATLTIADHTGDWYYKHTNTGATCEGPVSGTSKNLTGLDKNTAYTYSAYSDSGCSTLLATAAQFTTLVGDKVSVSNLSETLTSLIVTLGPGAAFAQEFTTGNTTGAYKLTKLTVDFGTVITASAVTVAIHDRQSNGTPSATARATLSGTPATGQAEFTCSGSGCDLDANTSYFVHVSANAANAAYPSSAASNDQTLAPTGTGWSIADGARSEAGSWAEGPNSLRIKVEATIHAKLTTSNVAATTATLTIAGHTGDWYYKHMNTGATCEGPVSGTSKNLTGLTAGTSYTYSAYSDSGCTTGNLLATAAAFTTPVSVSTLGGADNGVVNVGGGSPTQRVAQAFTTGSNTGGYTLSSIAIAFRATVGSPTALEVTLHAASGSNPNTGTTLATLSGSSPSTAGSYTYTCSSGCDLSASTTYFVYIKAPNSASGSHYLATFTSSDETLTPSGNGWSIADKGRLQYVGVGWFDSGSHYRIAVTAIQK